ncbi:uncharacterized protein LOC113760065 [Coffea eugenioides]|uniref:uncharacterized protein LOC113760065 n=1 Tax=Coffea eugenioides TaxID=49369 RepID=UPI000F609414|nr:uncharacterized protein LOC113760065 [Coffea eugenioides]
MCEEIIYGPKDAVPLAFNNHEAIVIEVITRNYKVKKVCIDNGSAIDVLYYKAFKELQLEDKQLIAVQTPLIGFVGPLIRPEEMITLMVMVGVSPKCRTVPIYFAMVKNPSSYNMILGRPTLNALRAGKEKLVAQAAYLEPWELAEKKERLETDEGSLELPISKERPDRVLKTCSCLSELTRKALESLLAEYAEIFTWSADDMLKNLPELAVHKLHVNPSVRPVK